MRDRRSPDVRHLLRQRLRDALAKGWTLGEEELDETVDSLIADVDLIVTARRERLAKRDEDEA